MTFGERIRQLRKAKNLHQNELAAKVGINFTYLSKIENDKLETGDFPSEDTIKKLEARIESSDACITDERRRELRQLLETLRAEVSNLAKTHGEQAQSIAGFADISTHEATRSEQNPQLLKLSLEGLNSSVEGFEKSHPHLRVAAPQLLHGFREAISDLPRPRFPVVHYSHQDRCKRSHQNTCEPKMAAVKPDGSAAMTVLIFPSIY